ncbi:multidrug and toxin extrusion protein 1-like isoform X2 [Cololabis saira]|uniref:multidrug and toxin extrusion protein 1-like isoform X2 n=1 Tax=Cololabis saira TaxID=129043 RepID=UPI002AD351A7|nr:multidrug and toxin extrusion protein 1-like isoform X2 [Cololabis saira]
MEDIARHSQPSSWRDCCLVKQIRRLTPVGFQSEIKELSKLSFPVVIAQLMIFAVSFVSTVFCGHFGRTELAGVSLAIAVINVTGISIGTGLASACDTLISQTYGGGNLLRVGVILQRAILILLLACFPCWAILINTEPILMAVRQEPEVARLSQTYVKIFMPALPAAFMFSLESRYLQNQGIIWPQVITGVVVNLLNALVNYIVLFPLKMGVEGSAIANSLSQFSMAGILYAYIMWKGLHKATWGGWSKECLQDWGSYIRLAIPAMVMLCAEWWTYEIGGFLAGLISEVELGAQSVVYELASVAYNFPLGFSVAGSVRVGNALGAGETEQAKLSAKTAIFCAGLVSVCLSVLIGSLKDHISYIFTYDELIRERVADIVSFYAPFLFLDAINAACGGIIRGAGLWTGLFLCVSLQCTFLVFYLSRLDWKTVTTEALTRAGVSDSSTDAGLQPEDAGNSLDQTEALIQVEGEEVPASKTAGDELPCRTLVLRRGLALAVMLVILAAGIISNVLITNLVT